MMETLVLLWWLSGCVPADAAATPEAAAVAARAEAVYHDTAARHRAGIADLDAVYRWSVRWRDAQAETARDDAHQGHTARMRRLSEQVADQVGRGAAPPGDADAAAFYLLEAQRAARVR